MRAHLYLPITDGGGHVIPDIEVRLLQPGTTTLISDTLYAAATGTTVVAQPFISANGVIDVYCDSPQRVRLGVTPPGQDEFYLEDVDVEPDAGMVVTATAPLRITNQPTSARKVLRALDSNTAQWGDQQAGDVVVDPTGLTNITHTTVQAALADLDAAVTAGGGGGGSGYDPTTADPVVIGAGADASGSQSTAVGAATRASAMQATALGEDATADGTQSSALGSNASATATNGLAVGDNSIAGTNWQESHANDSSDATAIGNGAWARGDGATAVGEGSSAQPHGTAIGKDAYAQGARSTAIGESAYAPTADTAIVHNDVLELVPSSPSGLSTGAVLRDSTGARWMVTVDTTGHLTTTAL